MSDLMRPIPLKKLIHWIFEEYKNQNSIFGIDENKFFRKNRESQIKIFDEICENPVGPAAGPHTQLAQNIVAAYLSGGRFFELKTVQKLDQLEIEKPCIDAQDEGYNTEWSTELTVTGAYEEYVKAYFLIYLLEKKLKLPKLKEKGFIFNMSVGYDLAGIQTEKVDTFIESMKDASGNEFFEKCQKEFQESGFGIAPSPKISNSITLSTLHGCPPEEIESICQYLLEEKKLHTFVKLNPTLLGYVFVRNTFDELGFTDIKLNQNFFTKDLQYYDAVEMLKRLKKFAHERDLAFGIKLSNTLPVVNTKEILPGDEMYLSGRALFPLTINLAQKLATEFDGDLKISYSGGANFFNIKRLFETGIQPITLATDLLKPGGYGRLKQISEILEKADVPGKIDLENLTNFANNALINEKYQKKSSIFPNLKINKKLPLTDCFIAPCMETCPIQQDVPEYIRLIHEKRFHEAFELIVSKNPLPHITGYICDHKCMFKCVRNDYESPVLIRELKRIAAEKGYQPRKLPKPEKFKDQKIAVVGAGPAGLSSAYFLAKSGFDVTLFDKTEKPGGMVQHGIPKFRLPDWAIEKDVEFIQSFGVKFQFGFDENFSIEKLKKQGYKYINLAIGAWNSRDLDLEGDSEKIFGAIQFLQNFKRNESQIKLGKNVAVIGGGNSAMDSARAAKRLEGVKKVYLIYRRTQEFMPADREEFENALADGVIFRELLSPVEFSDGFLKCQKMELGEYGADGRRKVSPIQGEYETFHIDAVLAAIGELVDYDILRKNGIEFDEKGNIKVDPGTNETSVKNVFIAGDAFRGPSTVVESIADGRKVANGILEKEGIKSPKNSKKFVFSEKRLDEIKNRKGVLREPQTETLSTQEEIEAETNRCLECNFICNKCVEVCPNRANIAIQLCTSFSDHNQILHIDGMCNECGNCETFCPYDGKPYRDKFTLFWSEEDFLNSDNAGFFPIENLRFKVRYKGISQIEFNESGEIVSGNLDSGLAEFIWKVCQEHGYCFLL